MEITKNVQLAVSSARESQIRSAHDQIRAFVRGLNDGGITADADKMISEFNSLVERSSNPRNTVTDIFSEFMAEKVRHYSGCAESTSGGQTNGND